MSRSSFLVLAMLCLLAASLTVSGPVLAKDSVVCNGVTDGWNKAVASGKASQIGTARNSARALSKQCPALQSRIASYDTEAKRKADQERERVRQIEEARVAERERERAKQREAARIAAEKGRERTAATRCDDQWQVAQRDQTLDGFEGFVRACGSHGQIAEAKARIAAIRANPLNIPGLMAANAPIPRQGLSAENQTRAQQCEAGSAVDCAKLGYDFNRGIGAPTYPDWAASMFVRACLLKNANGCSNLGSVLETGSGLRQDISRSKIFYELGCNGREYSACYGLARHFQFGISVPQNLEQAVKLFEFACNDGRTGGSVLGCLYGARILFDGRGDSPVGEGASGPVLPDRVKALRLVTAGLKLEPSNTYLIDMRDALSPAPPS